MIKLTKEQEIWVEGVVIPLKAMMDLCDSLHEVQFQFNEIRSAMKEHIKGKTAKKIDIALSELVMLFDQMEPNSDVFSDAIGHIEKELNIEPWKKQNKKYWDERDRKMKEGMKVREIKSGFPCRHVEYMFRWKEESRTYGWVTGGYADKETAVKEAIDHRSRFCKSEKKWKTLQISVYEITKVTEETVE